MDEEALREVGLGRSSRVFTVAPFTGITRGSLGRPTRAFPALDRPRLSALSEAGSDWRDLAANHLIKIRHIVGRIVGPIRAQLLVLPFH